MIVDGWNDLAFHIGHDIKCISYSRYEKDYVTIECMTCNVILLEYEKPTYLNEYKCSCGAEWDDTWSCGCDDECPDCGLTISPTTSTLIE